MKKTAFIGLIAACVICLAHSSSYAQGSTEWSSMNNFLTQLGISNDNLDLIKSQIDRRSQPFVKNVTISPEDPDENEPVSITATIITPKSPNGEEIYKAYINYITDDGKTMERVDMVKVTEDGNRWNGVIPGQPSGTHIIFGIQAVNAFDETYVEALCEMDSALKNSSKKANEACKDDKNPEYCISQWPEGCLFPMSISANKLGEYSENTGRIPTSLYITTTRVGFNKNKIFLEIETKDKISPGSYSPMNVYIYVAGWLNPDRSSSETGIDAILRQGAIAIYAPLNTTDKCAIYSLHSVVDVQIDNKSVTCAPNGNQLLFSIDRKAIEPNPSKTLEFIFMTFNLLQISPSDVDLQDLTLSTRVAFTNHSYYVR